MNSNFFFVYGTLRVGQGNWRWLLQGKPGVKHLGKARTVNKYTLRTAGIPFVYPSPATSHITGDLFEIISPGVIKGLDQLEGHREGVKDGYHREIIPVILDDTEFDAWLYFYYSAKPQGTIIESGDWLESQDSS